MVNLEMSMPARVFHSLLESHISNSLSIFVCRNRTV